MPPYPWLAEQDIDVASTAPKMKALRSVGVPYTDEEINNAQASIDAQATSISEALKKEKIALDKNKEMIALIAYMQRLGADIKKQNTVSN